jgi:hypothetical protein
VVGDVELGCCGYPTSNVVRIRSSDDHVGGQIGIHRGFDSETNLPTPLSQTQLSYLQPTSERAQVPAHYARSSGTTFYSDVDLEVVNAEDTLILATVERIRSSEIFR